MHPEQPEANFNPYAASEIEVPTAGIPLDAELADYEHIRQTHLKHEASIKSIGTLYVLGGFFGVLGGLGLIFQGVTGGGIGLIELLILIVVLFVSVLQIVSAFGLRRLAPWARTTSSVVAALGLLAVPIGTLISLYFLYLLLSKKATMIFSEEYQDVLQATPHIKYKTSIVVWIFLLLLLGLIVAVIVLPMLVGTRTK
jgi:hypothetical protein